MNGKISVVIPYRGHNGAPPPVVVALQRQTCLPDEILIVDGNCETDTPAKRQEGARLPSSARSGANAAGRGIKLPASADKGISHGIGIQWLPNTRGTIPAALNIGIAAASGEYIVRLDAHSDPLPDYLARCLQALARSDADVVGGRWEIRPGGAGAVARSIALAVSLPLGAGDAAYRLRDAPPQAGLVDTVPYGCFRKSLWERLGGFNERLLTNEDYEFNYRVREAGGRVYLDPDISSIYYARASLGDLARQYFRYGWWKAQMLRQHPHSLRLRQLLPLVAFGLFWSGLLATVLGWLPPSILMGASLAYFGATLVVGVRWAFRQRDPALSMLLPIAFAALQASWSLGASLSFLTAGRWPKWQSHKDNSP